MKTFRAIYEKTPTEQAEHVFQAPTWEEGVRQALRRLTTDELLHGYKLALIMLNR